MISTIASRVTCATEVIILLRKIAERWTDDSNPTGFEVDTGFVKGALERAIPQLETSFDTLDLEQQYFEHNLRELMAFQGIMRPLHTEEVRFKIAALHLRIQMVKKRIFSSICAKLLEVCANKTSSSTPQTSRPIPVLDLSLPLFR